MSKNKNQKVICRTHEEFTRLSDEYRKYAGRDIITDASKLEITVLSMPRKYKRKDDKAKKIQRLRMDREASYATPESDYSEYEERY